MKRIFIIIVLLLAVGGATYFPTQHTVFKQAYAKGYSIGQDVGFASGYHTGYDKGNLDGTNNTKDAATTFTLPSQTTTTSNQQQTTATALCSDGTYSYSAHHQGTCSHHGGVSVWYK
jgi:hypothetical protein